MSGRIIRCFECQVGSYVGVKRMRSDIVLSTKLYCCM
jgi:hypothetical protein